MATFSFTASEDTKCTISISNAEGRMLKTYSLTAEAEVSQRFSTDLADLPNGTYYCRVTSGGNVIAGKFIVAK